MNIPLDQLIRPLSRDEVKASIYSILKAVGLPVTAWQEGSVARTIIAIVAALFAGYTEVMVLAIRAGFLDLAEGIWLTLLAKHVYNVDRLEATFASGVVVIDNAGGGSYTFDSGEVIFLNPATKKTYTNAVAFTVGPLETGKQVDLRATEAGSTSTAGPGQINAFETKFLGLSCSNPAALIGFDAESDPALRQRCRDSLGALSPNGPEAAYLYVAKSARRPDKTPIGINRVYIPPALGDGSVYAYVATPSGPVQGVANDPATDLGIVAHDIYRKAVPKGVTAFVESAIPKPLSLTVDVWIDASASLSDADVQGLIQQKLNIYLPTIPIGGFVIPPASGRLLWRALIGQIEAASPYVIEARLSPELDIPMVIPEVATLASLTVNVHQVVGAAA
ncbi:baseplate J/gp47 family protein [Chondromyces crocatus]|uniref:Uncharacterized protein n=1 Tax=Chondromyces crocatus TaxID=52 RepID=A0A0K1ECF4_CHOCO|nr:baseplate J/gp47 family protein [Chondromyces crocatus]AKT38248.1 uncharacterized protein CMC5_023910 [Chondromyces crocatus]